MSQLIEETRLDLRERLADYSPEQADDDQQAVIYSEAEVIRLLAPAGSGKTQTIINRALVRMKEGTPAERLLVLTFDNAAANAAFEKLSAQLKRLGTEERGPASSTRNAFGY